MRTQPSLPRARSPLRQRGAALLTAMIIVTLVATLAAAMVWQQYRAVQVEAAEHARAQAAWILSGALDFAKLILREDLRTNRPTALTEPWATPLAESRLSTFLAADPSNADDGPEAFLSGNIDDAQARYNLTNLINNNQIVALELQTLERLCQTIGVETGVATRIATGLRDATAGSTGAAPLQPKTVAQLTWLGIDAATVQALRPYVVLLPAATPVNVNTASREVLSASIKGLDLATAERLVQTRQRAPFASADSFKSQLTGMQLDNPNIDVRSSFFEVHGRLRLIDRVLVERWLVQRVAGGNVLVLDRERVASLENVGS